ncbi:tRNA (cytidine(34)-2'-O)-methyltransferase [Deltaproteobacteria bacterium]|nr:tRNA (cytidine(34)-2'-O)-methyltransferase [Deltaproteobacteria bacterium]
MRGCCLFFALWTEVCDFVYAFSMQVVLFEPEIPPNTGNIARLCAAADIALHLIEPLGFSLEDRYLKRAGLDYWPHVRLNVWPSFAAYCAGQGALARLVATSSKGGEAVHHFPFTANDALLFGPETRGLPRRILLQAAYTVHIPLRKVVRSLNLSTAAGIVLYQALASSGLLDAENALC